MQKNKFGMLRKYNLFRYTEGLFSLFEKESRDDDENVRIKTTLLYSYQETAAITRQVPLARALDSYSR